MNKRLLSMFLALCMIVTMLPVSAMAEEIHITIGGSGEIISFAPLTETEKTVSPGKSGEDLELPETLTATVRTAVPAAENPTQDSGSPEMATPTTAKETEWAESTVDIPVKWDSHDYDPNTEGVYVFTPVIVGYTVSAKLPELTVTVGEMPLTAVAMPLGVGAQTEITNFADLQSAINGAASDLDLKLSDSYIDTAGKLTIPGTCNYNITIDLNSKTLYGGSVSAIEHLGSGTLTVDDSSSGGTVTSITSSQGTIAAVGGSVELLDGTVSNSNSSGGAAIYTQNATLNIRGGVVSATGNGGVAVWDNSSSSLNIYGGTLSAAGSDGNAVYSTNPASRLNISGGTISAVSSIAIYHPNTTIQRGTTAIIQGGSSAMQSAPTLDGGVQVMARTNYDGSGSGDYNSENIATYKYLKFEPVAGVTEQFTLTPGGTYYFDLSGEKGNVGTVNAALPDTSLHYVPFTYAGTVNAYSLTSQTESSLNTDRSLFVGDYNVGLNISWNNLNSANLIIGKSFDTNYKLRSMSAGSSRIGSASDGSDHIGQPDTNEWDQILKKSNISGEWIKNLQSIWSWGQETTGSTHAVVRGYNTVNHWDMYALGATTSAGFRPALEVLNPITLTPDGLKAVTLNLNGGNLRGSTANINIICAGDDFTAPSGEGLTPPEGTTFAGWKDSGGTTYAAGAHVPNTVTGLRAQWAEPATAYDIWVGGVQVTSANASDVLGDGTVSYTPAGGGAAQTLSLKGADIGAESQYRWDSTTVVDAKAYAAVYAKESLNVVLTGNNSLTGGSQGADKDESYGLYCGGALTITGCGALEAIGATMNKTSCVSYGLFVKGTLSIGDGTTVTARGGDVSSGSGISFGVFGKDGGLTVENATLTVASGTGYNSYGARIMQGDIHITNSNVTVTSSTTPQYSRALEAYAGNISISGGTVSASAENGANPAYCIAIYVPAGKNITISSSAVVTARAGSAGYGGRAMSQAPNLDSYGSEYYITASRAYNGGSPETYNASSITDYRYLDIRQRTATPTTGTTSASKSSASQNSISFTLTNSSAYTSALTWHVYSGSTGGTLANGVMATKSDDTLTLSHSANIPAATYYVAVTESGKAESGRLALTVGAFVPASLTGTATISNTAPRIGDILTASLVGGNNTGTLNYVWKAGGDQVGTDASYTVTAADFGEVITLEITSSVETGTVSSAPTTAVAKKSAPVAPGAPTLLLKTHNYVMLTANSDYDFSKDGIEWQASNTFIGLSENTKYTFYQRIIETADTEPSAASVGFDVTTDAATYTITANPTSKDFGSLAVGYGAPAAQTVTIRNTGNSSVTLTQPTSTNYTIGTLSTTTLAANGMATFTVTPKTGLAVGNYNETLTVSTDHSTNATVSLSFSVTAVPTYTITANPTSKNFGSLAVGYSAPTAQTMTITNTGNTSVTLTQPTSTNYIIGALSTTTLTANGTATFTVTPKTGLAVGNYNETLTVSTDHSTNATVELSFAVTEAPTYIVTFNPNGGTVSETSRSVASGTAVGTLPTPTRSGSYSFDGWYTAASGGTQISASTTVSANVTYYAHWTYTGGNSGPGTPTPPDPGIPVVIDGKTVNIGTEKKTGDTTTVTVDQSKLAEYISGAASGSSVIVQVSETGSATASLMVQNIADMATNGMTLTVQTGSVSYNLSTSAIDTSALETAFPGADMSKVPFDVTITNSSVSVAGETLVLSPVSFTVTATYNGQTVSVDTFSAYIDRVIEVTKEQAAKITTAVVVNADGSVRHVPTNVIEKDGKYYAVVSSRTNSTYALIQNEVTFADAKGKWYEAAVNEMGSRKIIGGRSAAAFDGGASITRAEFSAILVRALGLPADGASTFADVPTGAWYAGAVATAVQYGITDGRGNNRFDPSAAITRQEAMLMLQRAAALTEFTGAAGNLDRFADADGVDAWARDAAMWSVGSGLIQGADGKLNPTADITRAESATIILRLLQKVGLVDVRSEA